MGLVGRRAAADKECVAARVLVVDDHPLTRDALAALLRSHGFELAGIASDGEEAIAAAAQTQPDLVLLDLLMPGLDGLSALPRLREVAPGCEVVVLTASGTEENLLAAIRGGAAGYLLKTESPERIADFLEGVVHGDAALSGPVARRLLDQVRSGGRGSGVPDRIASRPLRPRARGAAPARRAPRHRRDRAAAVHLGAHRPLAREEPPAQARRLVAPRGARAARARARLSCAEYDPAGDAVRPRRGTSRGAARRWEPWLQPARRPAWPV